MNASKLCVVVCLCVSVLNVSEATTVPRSKHVWIITEENHSYESVIGNSNMPYYNYLANRYALATQYYANRHSSLPALMRLVAGQDVTTNNKTTSCFDVDNVVRHLLWHGMTWRSYAEDLPYAGFTGLSWANYVRRHNPLIDFTDVCASSEKMHSVPFRSSRKTCRTTTRLTTRTSRQTCSMMHMTERARKRMTGWRTMSRRFWRDLSFSPVETACCLSFGMRATLVPIIAAVNGIPPAAEDGSPRY
jgi:hypothetical protein